MAASCRSMTCTPGLSCSMADPGILCQITEYKRANLTAGEFESHDTLCRNDDASLRYQGSPYSTNALIQRTRSRTRYAVWVFIYQWRDSWLSRHIDLFRRAVELGSSFKNMNTKNYAVPDWEMIRAIIEQVPLHHPPLGDLTKNLKSWTKRPVGAGKKNPWSIAGNPEKIKSLIVADFIRNPSLLTVSSAYFTSFPWKWFTAAPSFQEVAITSVIRSDEATAQKRKRKCMRTKRHLLNKMGIENKSPPLLSLHSSTSQGNHSSQTHFTKTCQHSESRPRQTIIHQETGPCESLSLRL